MARFVSLNSGPGWAALVALTLTGFSPELQAAPALAPTGVPATNAAPVAPSQEALMRYGKILTPGNEVAHPLKLKLPFPDVGEVKVPTQDELTMREKLEQLAELSDADLHTQLEKWPLYSKMSLRDQGALLQRIQDFRDFHSNVAKAKAHDLGLSNLPPDQQVRFEKEYWDKRLQMDRDLAKQFEPIFQAREQKLKDDLLHEYSVLSPAPVAQVAKPPVPVGSPPAANPKSSAATAEMTNVVQPTPPIAQGAR